MYAYEFNVGHTHIEWLKYYSTTTLQYRVHFNYRQKSYPVAYLVAAILEEADQQNGHDHYDGDKDSSIDQGKTKCLNSTGGIILIKGKVVTEMMKIINS